MSTHKEQKAYSMNRFKEMMKLPDSVYWRYMVSDNIAKCKSHASLHNVVLHRDHRFWKTNYPPLVNGCRCKVQAHDEDSLISYGLCVTPDSKIEEYL